MRRLIWGFAGRTYLIVGNLMSRLIYRCTIRCHFTIKSIFLISYLFWYHKIDFSISQNELDFFWITNSIFDITKSNVWYYKIKRILWYQNRFSDIKNMISIAFAQGRLWLVNRQYYNVTKISCSQYACHLCEKWRLCRHIGTGSVCIFAQARLSLRHSTIR